FLSQTATLQKGPVSLNEFLQPSLDDGAELRKLFATDKGNAGLRICSGVPASGATAQGRRGHKKSHEEIHEKSFPSSDVDIFLYGRRSVLSFGCKYCYNLALPLSRVSIASLS
ncbi:hypothetical protein EDB84DRAFT_1274519, partial [Lactarius hengduanensis]